jgi:hypothetical protein
LASAEQLMESRMTNEPRSALILGAFICVGMIALGWVLGSSAIRFKEFERVVTVKGLAEREVPADVAVWPVRFAAASNDLAALYATMEANSKEIVSYLQASGFTAEEITNASPLVTDKYAQEYGGQEINMRYTAQQVITVYSNKIDAVRAAQGNLTELGKKGIALGGREYDQKTLFLFTGLNAIKPAMIEEAARNARAVAEQFASDANSQVGKLKSANQGQFTIEDRDSNTPYLKKVRVVSTVEYYLAD